MLSAFFLQRKDVLGYEPPLPLQIISNQLNENIIQGWLLHVISLFLTAKRCAGVKVELQPHCLLFCGFMFLCVQLSKNITMIFIYNYSQF